MTNPEEQARKKDFLATKISTSSDFVDCEAADKKHRRSKLPKGPKSR